jgi:stage III sporulation protein AA
MQIALRVMSPDVIVIDELGGEEETLEILSSVNAGVKIVATAHARSIEELMKRKNIMPLIESEAFDVFFGIGYEGGGRCVKTDVIGI